MRSLRIAIALADPPLPFGTAAGRVFYALLRGLAGRGHRVTAFVACGGPEEVCATMQLFPAPLYDIRCYLRPHRTGIQAKWQTLRQPFSYVFSNQFRDDLRQQLDCFDILHLEELFGGWLGVDHTERSLLSILYLPSVDLRGMFPTTLRKAAERFLMKRAEKRLLRSFKFLRAGSPELMERIHKVNLSAHVMPVPISLDLQFYPYISDENRPSTPLISLIGSMKWQPSYSAAVRLLTRLYPGIKRRVPSARFQIVGWSARSALCKYASLPDVEILEDVPDTRPYLHNSSVLLYAPQRGSGPKIKVFEAMALGVPVVTTADGVEGLPAVDRVEVAVAKDDDDLIERTVALLRDRAAQDRQRKAARELLDAHCNPALTAESFEHIYARML